MSKIGPFEYLTSVSYTKDNLMIAEDKSDEKTYIPFLTNKSLSYHQDCVLYSNEMNIRPGLDKKMQYEYFLHALRKRKRFKKWEKSTDSDDVAAVMEYYNCGYMTAIKSIQVLKRDQIDHIKQFLHRGGIQK